MEQSTQTQQLLEDYVSINERRKRSKVSKGSKYTPEEKAERAISTMRYYYNNLENRTRTKTIACSKNDSKSQEIKHIYYINPFLCREVEYLLFKFPCK